MSLYREAGRERRRRRLIAGGVIAAVVAIGVVIAVVASGGSETTHADRAKAAAAAAERSSSELELVGIEYEQAVKGGKVVALSELTAAQDHAARAREAIAEHAADVRSVDPAAPEKIDAALAGVAAAASGKPDLAAVTAAADAARARLSALQKAAGERAP